MAGLRKLLGMDFTFRAFLPNNDIARHPIKTINVRYILLERSRAKLYMIYGCYNGLYLKEGCFYNGLSNYQQEFMPVKALMSTYQ